ncbi:MAG TPA: hypothetical protein DCY35_07410 [Prolixibacteraceae bacterium]|nr:hypothetical protein [Prolixibacteraceae bacterium]
MSDFLKEISMKYVIPLELVELEDHNYHLTVTSRFESGKDGMWIIDSGASKTVFDESLKELYVPVSMDETIQIQSAGIGEGRLETTLGELSPFLLGEYKHPALQVALIDLSHINKLYYHVTSREICGLIGSDFLLSHRAIIDYGKLELVLHKKAKPQEKDSEKLPLCDS